MQSSKPSLLRAMMDAFRLPDLRNRILFTLAMLVVFRIIAHIPLPGVDLQALSKVFSNNQLLGMLDLFSGGAMRTLSVAAMGVYPYITASIVMQLLVPVIPRLQSLAKEGEAGRNQINVITHWVTLPLAMLQGYGQLILLSRQNPPVITGIGLTGPDLLPTISMIISMSAGTLFLVWLGELITERGIGNGISILIFGGIVAGLPNLVGSSLLGRSNLPGLLTFAVLGVLTVTLIVIFTEAHRRIPVQYARATYRGGRMYRQGGSTYLPLRVNTAGMIPLIFAISIMIFPGTIASYFQGSPGWGGKVATFIMRLFDSVTMPWAYVYWGLYFFLVVGFAFFYTMVIFQQMDLANTLQKQGGFVPGIRPGKPTADYFNKVITHITWGGALFLAFVAILPFFARQATNVQVLQLSSTGLLIVVGVVLDTMKQLEGQLLMRHYQGFIK